MKTYINPNKKEWNELSKRPIIDEEKLSEVVRSIIENVKINGDQALKEYALKFDNVKIEELLVSKKEIEQAIYLVPQELKDAIQIAYANITNFTNLNKLLSR